MNKKNLVIFGGGHQSSYSIEIAELLNEFNIVGIIDSVNSVGAEIYGYKVIGRQEDISSLIKNYNIEVGFIAIGDNWSRKKVYDFIIEIQPDFYFTSLVHPTAIIGKNVIIGNGTLIMAGVTVNINTKIEKFAFLATCAQIDHDCYLGEFSSVSAGSIFGGCISLMKYSAVTLGVTVLDRICIGENTVIGAGSLVTKDLPENVLAFGTPAKIIRERKLGERFLK
jgi:sugar O-acyltransferase (sialic acid O-acetyltransferase NeuD family)